MKSEYLFVAILSSAFYGSQFVPQKYCQKFSHELYNVSMNFGILFTSFIFFLIFSKIGFGLDGNLEMMSALVAFASGGVWVIGNRFLLMSVRNAGMGRSFTIINMVSVVTYLGGVIFLNELSGFGQGEVAISGLGVLLVTVGSMLVSFTCTRDERGNKVKYGMTFAFLSSFFFGASNLLIVVAMNMLNLPFTYTFFFIGLGAFAGMILTTFLKSENIENWRRAPKRWHALAFLSGILWGLGDVLGVL
ncbi:MAG: GRP family sugar transporter, partial [Thermoplasmata archaeon]